MRIIIMSLRSTNFRSQCSFKDNDLQFKTYIDKLAVKVFFFLNSLADTMTAKNAVHPIKVTQSQSSLTANH